MAAELVNIALLLVGPPLEVSVEEILRLLLVLLRGLNLLSIRLSLGTLRPKSNSFRNSHCLARFESLQFFIFIIVINFVDRAVDHDVECFVGAIVAVLDGVVVVNQGTDECSGPVFCDFKDVSDCKFSINSTE